MKKSKTPKNNPTSGSADLAGTDMTATFDDSTSNTTAAVPPAVADLTEHLKNEESHQGGRLLSGSTGRGKSDPAMIMAPDHSPAPVIREQEAWDYPGNVPSERPLQVWRTGPDSVLAMVSDRPTDTGTSTTNAAEQIVAKLQAEYPGQQVEVIERLVQPEIFGGGVDYSRIEIGTNGSATWTPVTAADLEARLWVGPGSDTTPPVAPQPATAPAPKTTRTPKPASAPAAGPPRMSSDPLLSNGWGGRPEEGQVYFHDDGAIGMAIKYLGADAHLQVEGGALANVLGQIATEGANGRISAQETLDSVKRVRDQVPPGSAARRALDEAVQKMDAPSTPLPQIPDTAPEPLRQLVKDLHAIPLVRRNTSRELDPLVQILHDHSSGTFGRARLHFAVRDLRNREHESVEGKFAIDDAIDTALKALKAEDRT